MLFRDPPVDQDQTSVSLSSQYRWAPDDPDSAGRGSPAWSRLTASSIRRQSDYLSEADTPLIEFSNGDPKPKLSPLNNGYWQSTWQAGSQQTEPLTLTITATDRHLNIQGASIVNGGLGGAQPGPVIFDDGVVGTVTMAPSVPLAPGDLITIEGQRLADGTVTAPNTIPVLSLGNSIVSIGDGWHAAVELQVADHPALSAMLGSLSFSIVWR